MIPAVMVNQIAANTGAVVRNFFIGMMGVAGGWQKAVEPLSAAGELLEGGQGPAGGAQSALERQGHVNLDLVGLGVLALADGHQIGAAGPADRAGDVKEGQTRDREVAGVAPAAVDHKMGQAIRPAEGLAVALESGLGLLGARGGGPRLEAGVLGAGGETADLGMGHRGKAEEQEGGEEDRHQTAGEKTAHGSGHGAADAGVPEGECRYDLPRGQDVTSGQ